MPKADNIASTPSTPLAIEINILQSQVIDWADQISNVEQARIFLRAAGALLGLLDGQVAQREIECARAHQQPSESRPRPSIVRPWPHAEDGA